LRAKTRTALLGFLLRNNGTWPLKSDLEPGDSL
jgi:hypothetical protein